MLLIRLRLMTNGMNTNKGFYIWLLEITNTEIPQHCSSPPYPVSSCSATCSIHYLSIVVMSPGFVVGLLVCSWFFVLCIWKMVLARSLDCRREVLSQIVGFAALSGGISAVTFVSRHLAFIKTIQWTNIFIILVHCSLYSL